MGKSNKKMENQKNYGTCEIEFPDQRNKKEASKGQKRSNQSFKIRRKQLC